MPIPYRHPAAKAAGFFYEYPLITGHSLFQEMMQMKCAWQDFLNVLPPELRIEVDRQGKGGVWELRMRCGEPAEIIGPWGSKWINNTVSKQDIHYVVNMASKYSPWASHTVSEGYLTTSGGHRIGLCGKGVIKEDGLTTIKDPTSLCIRVARDHPGIAKGLPDMGSVLIIGKPGAGKTSLLRDFIRHRSETGFSSVAVVDERGELFPDGIFHPGKRTDILSGCSKACGIEMVLRTMGPGIIAVDEITADADCDALLQCGWCGVSLIATAHASCREELHHRPVYQKLISYRLFDWLVILQQDKSWKLERM